MLLQSLTRMGYLHHDPLVRTYLPTMSVALLGNWVDSGVVADGDLLLLMRRLSRETEQAVVLAARSGQFVRYVHVIQATAAARLYVVQGSIRPLAKSGAGYVLMSQMSDANIRKFLNRINAEAPQESDWIRLPDLMEQVQLVRRKGHAITSNIVTLGTGIIAMPLPGLGPGDSPLVIGLGGINEVLKAHETEFVRIMKAEIQAFRASPRPPALLRTDL
jgi:DNA-binding IclR family transcriptional regulator